MAEGFDARAAVIAGMDGAGATSDNSAPAADAPEAGADTGADAGDAGQEGDAATAVGDAGKVEGEQDAGGDEVLDKAPAKGPETDDAIEERWNKFDLSKLPPEARFVVEGMKKELQRAATQKFEEAKRIREEALQSLTKGQEKPPTFDDASMNDLDGDVVAKPIKQLAAVTRYQDARIAELTERLERADKLATRTADMYLADKFDQQYDQLTGPGGEYESTPLDRNVLMEIIKTSDDPRLGIGPNMVKNALATILGAQHKAKAVTAKAQAKAKTHALPATGGGVSGKPLTGMAKVKADILAKWGGGGARKAPGSHFVVNM